MVIGTRKYKFLFNNYILLKYFYIFYWFIFPWKAVKHWVITQHLHLSILAKYTVLPEENKKEINHHALQPISSQAGLRYYIASVISADQSFSFQGKKF